MDVYLNLINNVYKVDKMKFTSNRNYSLLMPNINIDYMKLVTHRHNMIYSYKYYILYNSNIVQ